MPRTPSFPLEVEPNKTDKICLELASHKEVNLILTLINASGLMVGTHTSTNEALYRFVKEKIAYHRRNRADRNQYPR